MASSLALKLQEQIESNPISQNTELIERFVLTVMDKKDIHEALNECNMSYKDLLTLYQTPIFCRLMDGLFAYLQSSNRLLRIVAEEAALQYIKQRLDNADTNADALASAVFKHPNTGYVQNNGSTSIQYRQMSDLLGEYEETECQ